MGARAKVFDENDQPVLPGSGVRGMVAVGPPHPVGYYKDPEKTARTLRVIDGVKYSIPGDWCVVEADGTLTLLGRGNACINTAGEKVFPEEVEEALKTHPDVQDALVVGLADPKWGQSVTGVVRLHDGRSLDEGALIAHVRQTLAAYKAPKRIVTGDVSLRAPNGKADYKTAVAFAVETLGASTPAWRRVRRGTFPSWMNARSAHTAWAPRVGAAAEFMREGDADDWTQPRPLRRLRRHLPRYAGEVARQSRGATEEGVSCQ